MPTLTFHETLYSEGAIESALKVFADHGTFAMTTGETHYEVSVEPNNAALADALMGELGNYALALTIEEKREKGDGAEVTAAAASEGATSDGDEASDEPDTGDEETAS